MNKKVSMSVALAITLIAMTVTFSITMIVSMNIFDTTVSDVTEKQAFYNKISEIDTFVRANFFGDIEDETLFDNVARGFVSGLGDANSTYYTAEEYSLLQDIESGRVVGIGLVASKDTSTGNFRILKVFANSPAASQGITEGMWITAVDDTPARNIATTNGLYTLLRGEQGTNVSLACLELAGGERTFQIQRINYQNPTIEYQLEDDYAYIRIYSFTSSTASDFDFAVQDALSNDVKGFIFDLRGNSTGQIDYAYDMIDLLAPLGTIAKAEYRSGVTRVLRYSDEENQVDLPMVCLVNGSTAGAAELFAACLRELSDAELVGERSLGRGTIQRAPYQLADGSAIVITQAKLYFTEEDDSFDGVGLVPDHETAGDADNLSYLYIPDFVADSQLRQAMSMVQQAARRAGLEAGNILDDDGTDTSGDSSAIYTPESSPSSEIIENEGTADSAVDTTNGLDTTLDEATPDTASGAAED